MIETDPKRTHEPSVSWNPDTKQLTQTERRELSSNLELVDIDLISGYLRVEEADGEQTPQLVVETIIAARSESEAKRRLADHALNFTIDISDRTLRIEDNIESSAGIMGENIIVGNVIGANVYVGGEVIVNGRRITSYGQEHESLAKAIKVVLPKDKAISLNVTDQSGNIDIGKVKGRVNLSTQSGRIQVEKCIGNFRVDVTSGNVNIAQFLGELKSRIMSGDIRINQLRGTIDLDATSGQITINDAVLSGGQNRIKATSGDIHLGISNKSLALSAKTTSGDMDIDRDGFTLTHDCRRKKSRGTTVIQSGFSVISVGGSGWGDTIEGYYGEKEQAPELSVEVTSGSVAIERTGKNIEAPPETPEDKGEYAECSYCGSAYPTQQIKVKGDKISEIHNAICQQCNASEPIVHQNH